MLIRRARRRACSPVTRLGVADSEFAQKGHITPRTPTGMTVPPAVPVVQLWRRQTRPVTAVRVKPIISGVCRPFGTRKDALEDGRMGFGKRLGSESTAPCNYLSARRFFALRAPLTPVATPLRVLRAPGSLANGQTPHRPAILPSRATGRQPLRRSITKSRSGGAATTG
jgi:hypothetical protein